MEKLPEPDCEVNSLLGPLIDAITERWKKRDARALSRLREAAPSGSAADLAVSGDPILRIVCRDEGPGRFQRARSKEVGGILGREDVTRPFRRGDVTTPEQRARF